MYLQRNKIALAVSCFQATAFVRVQIMEQDRQPRRRKGKSPASRIAHILNILRGLEMEIHRLRSQIVRPHYQRRPLPSPVPIKEEDVEMPLPPDDDDEML